MKVLAFYKVMKYEDGTVITYDELGVHAPSEISQAIAGYFEKRILSKPAKRKEG